MRTAITTAITHAGQGVLLSGKEVPLLKQRDLYLQFRKQAILEGAHPQYKEISLQESDGHEELLTFRSPAAQKQHLDLRAKEKKQHEAQVEAERQREGAPRAQTPPKPAKETKQELTAEEKAAAELAAKNAAHRSELLAKSKGELLAIVEKLKSEGKTVEIGKGNKIAVVNGILLAAGYTVTPEEAGEASTATE